MKSSNFWAVFRVKLYNGTMTYQSMQCVLITACAKQVVGSCVIRCLMRSYNASGCMNSDNKWFLSYNPSANQCMRGSKVKAKSTTPKPALKRRVGFDKTTFCNLGKHSANWATRKTYKLVIFSTIQHEGQPQTTVHHKIKKSKGSLFPKLCRHWWCVLYSLVLDPRRACAARVGLSAVRLWPPRGKSESCRRCNALFCSSGGGVMPRESRRSAIHAPHRPRLSHSKKRASS